MKYKLKWIVAETDKVSLLQEGINLQARDFQYKNHQQNVSEGRRGKYKAMHKHIYYKTRENNKRKHKLSIKNWEKI